MFRKKDPYSRIWIPRKVKTDVPFLVNRSQIKTQWDKDRIRRYKELGKARSTLTQEEWNAVVRSYTYTRSIEEESLYWDFTGFDFWHALQIEEAMKEAPEGYHSRLDGQYYTCRGKCPHIKECMLYGECHNMRGFFPDKLKHRKLRESHIPQVLPEPAPSLNDLDVDTFMVIVHSNSPLERYTQERLEGFTKNIQLPDLYSKISGSNTWRIEKREHEIFRESYFAAWRVIALSEDYPDEPHGVDFNKD